MARRRPFLVLILTVVAAFTTLLAMPLAGPVRPLDLAADLLCELSEWGNGAAATVRWENPATTDPRVTAALGHGTDPCAASARARVLRYGGIASLGSSPDIVRLALILIAAGHAATLVAPRAVFLWLVGLAMLYIAVATTAVFELGFWLSAASVVLTLFYVT